MKTFVTILITATLAISATWLLMKKSAPPTEGQAGAPVFYQSAMHPWIKSDKPGRCTICGMELTPVYAGEKGFDATGGENIVALTRDQIHALGVRTETAAVRPLVRTLQVAGMIDDDATRHRVLSAYVDGRIEKLHLNYMGAEVEAGQPLAEIYSPPLLQAEREYRQLSGELRQATALRLRQMGLSPDQIADVAGKPADSLTSQILSPVSGTVVAQDVYEGQYVATGQKLFEIADFSTMWFMFRAYEQDMPWIHIGQTVSVTTPAIPGKSFEGKITFIDPNFDDATRSAKIRVELPNPKVAGRRELLHKLYAEGMLKMETPPVLTIPRTTVIRTGPEAVIYTDQGGGAYARTVVTTGRQGDGMFEILSGLKEGEKVVSNGNLLIDGQAEMNTAFVTTEAPATGIELTADRKQAISAFIALNDAMSAALAGDDLAAFNKAAEPAMKITGDFIKALDGLPVDQDAIAILGNSRHFHGFGDLKSARAAFHPFSMSGTAILTTLRATKDFPALQIWECSMVDQALPDAPKKGRWIQAAGRPGANPYFGAEMIDCGKEIKP